MTKEAQSLNNHTGSPKNRSSRAGTSDFGIRISFVIRHSSFGFNAVTGACARASNTLAVL